MKRVDEERVPRWRGALLLRRSAFVACALGALLAGASAGCGPGNNATNGSDQSADMCTPGDQDGVNGGYYTILVSVSDTGFTVGGVNSGSTEPNITVQNLGIVTLTLTNTGTRPHDMVVQCIPTGLPAVCMNPTSCFDNPNDAGTSTPNAVTLIPPIQPGTSQTLVVQVPLVEGIYNFISDVPADDTTFEPDGGVSGNLVGDFVLM
jgi:hypothetical protein